MSKLEQEFISDGGIKERMYRVRTGFCDTQAERIKQLEEENTKLRGECQQWKKLYEDLKNNAQLILSTKR